MGWHADTNFAQIGKGTILRTMFTPHVEGYDPPPLAPDVAMSIAFADNSRAAATIVQASVDEFVFEMPDKTQWLATPQTDQDLSIPEGAAGGIPSRSWVVRSQVK